jgi:hypothetical protein
MLAGTSICTIYLEAGWARDDRDMSLSHQLACWFSFFADIYQLPMVSFHYLLKADFSLWDMFICICMKSFVWCSYHINSGKYSYKMILASSLFLLVSSVSPHGISTFYYFQKINLDVYSNNFIYFTWCEIFLSCRCPSAAMFTVEVLFFFFTKLMVLYYLVVYH